MKRNNVLEGLKALETFLINDDSIATDKMTVEEYYNYLFALRQAILKFKEDDGNE